MTASVRASQVAAVATVRHAVIAASVALVLGAVVPSPFLRAAATAVLADPGSEPEEQPLALQPIPSRIVLSTARPPDAQPRVLDASTPVAETPTSEMNDAATNVERDTTSLNQNPDSGAPGAPIPDAHVVTTGAEFDDSDFWCPNWRLAEVIAIFATQRLGRPIRTCEVVTIAADINEPEDVPSDDDACCFDDVPDVLSRMGRDSACSVLPTAYDAIPSPASIQARHCRAASRLPGRTREFVPQILQTLGVHGVVEPRPLGETELTKLLDANSPIIAEVGASSVVIVSGYVRIGDALTFSVLDPFSHQRIQRTYAAISSPFPHWASSIY